MRRQLDRLSLLAGIALVSLASVAAHAPVLAGEILGWDDRRALLETTGWRGLGWQNLRFAFSSTEMGIYRPLTWLSYGLDYELSGMSPYGFHRTGLACHVAAALALLLVLRAWLRLEEVRAWFWPALFGALAFALHPLRAQVSAWISARADALAATWLLIATLAWLTWLRTKSPLARGGWHAFFSMSLLAKPVALFAPLVWWLAHAWLATRRELAPRARVDLILGIGLAAIVTMPLLLAKGVVASGSGLTLPPRAALTAFHNAVFPLWQTLWPSPLGFYEPKYPLDVLAPRYVIGTLAALALAAVILRSRRQGLFLLFAGFVLLLGPVLGLVPFGYELVADRFSYTPSLLLSAALAWNLVGAKRSWPFVVLCTWLAIMASLTFRQVQVWRDDVAWWTHNDAYFPDSAMANAGIADDLLHRDRLEEARRFYTRAHALQPTYTSLFLNVGLIDVLEGKYQDAITHLTIFLQARPSHLFARELIMHAYRGVGRDSEAAAIEQMLRAEGAYEKARK